MATDDHRRRVVVGVYLLIAVAVIDSVQARIEVPSSGISNAAEFAKPPRGTVKTIQTGYGDVVDCVDIHKQPALDHPLLKNHKIQMKPSFLKEEEDKGHQTLQGQSSGFQDTSAHCPEGTIPIVRENATYGVDAKGPFNIDALGFPPRNGHNEYAVVTLNGDEGTYHGAEGTFNVWTPQVQPGEISTSQIWMLSGPPESVNAVEAGWMADSSNVTRIFTYWTSDSYNSTGCLNLRCPGFVQTHNQFGPGSRIEPVSKYNGEQTAVYMKIEQELTTGHWWFYFRDVVLGYWPATIFTNLHDGARAISWGGQVTDSGRTGMHTMTQMGSGHPPRKGYFMRSSFISRLAYIDKPALQPTSTPKEKLVTYVTERDCYDLVLGPPNVGGFDTHFYFGGPGLSLRCP